MGLVGIACVKLADSFESGQSTRIEAAEGIVDGMRRHCFPGAPKCGIGVRSLSGAGSDLGLDGIGPCSNGDTGAMLGVTDCGIGDPAGFSEILD